MSPCVLQSRWDAPRAGLRSRSWRRRAGIVAIAAVLGLAAAPHAFAAEEPTEPPTTASTVDALDALVEGPVDAASADELVDATLAAVEAEVISATEQADITVSTGLETTAERATSANEVTSADGVAEASGTPVEPDTGLHSSATRPSAEGDESGTDGATNAGESALLEAATEEPASEADSGSEAEKIADRYQEHNSQYQASDSGSIDSWIWQWDLQLDCEGNIASTSTELGASTSPNWDWQWQWEWCGDGAPGFADALLGDLAEPTVEAGPGTPPEGAATEETAPWHWRWSFALCGESAQLTTQVRAEGAMPAAWAWDWSWTWTCRTAGEPGGAAPESGTGPPPGHDGRAPPLLSPPALVAPHVEPPAGVPATFLLPLDRGLLALDELAQLVPAALLPGLYDVLADPSSIVELGALAATGSPLATPEHLAELGLGAAIATPRDDAVTLGAVVGGRPDGGATSRASSADRPSRPHGRARLAAAPRWQARLTPRRRAETTPARETSRGAEARPSGEPRPPRLPSPLRPDARPASAGGVLPGAPALGIAALVALLLLTVPEVGRRLVAARELRPRSAYRPPIDHPG